MFGHGIIQKLIFFVGKRVIDNCLVKNIFCRNIHHGKVKGSLCRVNVFGSFINSFFYTGNKFFFACFFVFFVCSNDKSLIAFQGEF
jgi:hypothetical protein